jgi:hypothetical protein
MHEQLVLMAVAVERIIFHFLETNLSRPGSALDGLPEERIVKILSVMKMVCCLPR